MNTDTLLAQHPDFKPTMRERMSIEALVEAANDYDEFLVTAMEEFAQAAQASLGLRPGEEGDGLALAREALVDNELANSLSSEGVVENLTNAWQSLTQKEATFLEKIQGTFGGIFNTAGNGLTTIEAALRDFHKGNAQRFAGTRQVHTALAVNLENGEITNGLARVLNDSMNCASNVMEAIVSFQPVLSTHQTFKFGKAEQNKILEKNRKDFVDFFQTLKKSSGAHVKRTSANMVQLANARLCGNFVFNMTEPTEEISDFGAGSALKARSVIRRYTFTVDRETALGVDVSLTYPEVVQIAHELNNYQQYVSRSLDRMKRARFGAIFDNVDMAAMAGMTWGTVTATLASPATSSGVGAVGSISVLMYQFIRSFNRLAAMRRRAVETYVQVAFGLIRYNNFLFREGAKLITSAVKQ